MVYILGRSSPAELRIDRRCSVMERWTGGNSVLGADEVDLTVTMATVFGTIADPMARLRAIRAGRVLLQQVADKAVTECRRNGSSWRHIASALGEAPATAFRHYGKDDHPDDLDLGEGEG